jgi:phage shock protein A
LTAITDIKYTCPDIEKAKEIVQDVQKEVDYALSVVEEACAQYCLECIDRQLYYLPDTLESLRTSNSALREAASDLQEKVDSLKEEIGALKDQINELEDEVEAEK